MGQNVPKGTDLFKAKRRRKVRRRKKKELTKTDNSRKNIKKGKRSKELSLKTKRILLVALIILAIIVLIFAINLAISTNRWKRMATEMTANEGSVDIDTDGTEKDKTTDQCFLPPARIPL